MVELSLTELAMPHADTEAGHTCWWLLRCVHLGYPGHAPHCGRSVSYGQYLERRLSIPNALASSVFQKLGLGWPLWEVPDVGLAKSWLTGHMLLSPSGACGMSTGDRRATFLKVPCK